MQVFPLPGSPVCPVRVVFRGSPSCGGGGVSVALGWVAVAQVSVYNHFPEGSTNMPRTPPQRPLGMGWMRRLLSGLGDGTPGDSVLTFALICWLINR